MSCTEKHQSLVFLGQSQSCHFLAHRDDRKADEHENERGDIVATLEVVDALQEEEQRSTDEKDGEDFEEIISHSCLLSFRGSDWSCQ